MIRQAKLSRCSFFKFAVQDIASRWNLFKDYASELNPAEEGNIKEMWLAACIEKYVTDANLKETAKRAVWLGNDETHYVKKWDDKDLQDMKMLISLTIYWIEAQKLTEQLLMDMPAPKKE